MLMAAPPVSVVNGTPHRPLTSRDTCPELQVVPRPHTLALDGTPAERSSKGCDPTVPRVTPVNLKCELPLRKVTLTEVRCASSELRVTPTEVKCDPPMLRVTPSDLTYRGEGADHVVLRVLRSGQVLRLRKTTVGGSVTSRKELVVRAARDLTFLHNVARRILGPLLTDESCLVILDPDTLADLKLTVEPRRQGHRQHKEINTHGVACICPDAASIFISRRDSVCPASSSSPVLANVPSSLSSLSTSSLPASPLPSAIADISSSASPTIEFSVTALPLVSSFSPPSPLLLPPPVSPSESLKSNAPLNLRQSQSWVSTNTSSKPGSLPWDDLNHRSSPAAKPESPSSTGGIQATRKSALGTSRVLDATSAAFEKTLESRNVCIEIKPKQGFLDSSTPDLPLCRYCVKQFLKRGKDDQARSSYCPLDLFSGELWKMRRAVENLMHSPQNNFKVFQDGEPVDDCRPFSYLRDVIIAALAFDFTSGTARVPEAPGLSPRSPLGRILAFQTLDQLGVFKASRMYQSLAKYMGSYQQVDSLLQDLRHWADDPDPSHLHCGRRKHDSHFEESCHTSTRKRKHHLSNHSRKTVTSESQGKSDKPRAGSVATPEDCDGSLANAVRKVSVENMELRRDSDGPGESVSEDEDEAIEEMVRKLQRYLLSTTAKDLSLMILLSGPYTSLA
ncbi:uncharacterized protein [Cherax quadricarinatus]|uniref:uncharacterized protein isoform X2 n=1 Tax=Cherax quadricarinatus TaxID=27406 RepID=UPI00387EA2B5